MGSKMAAATRAVQVVKPHTPLIKFPDRKSGPRPKIQESLQASMPSLLASKPQESVGGISPAFQNISPVRRVQGTPDTSELTRTLPQKYRRKQMSDEEIEYIQFSVVKTDDSKGRMQKMRRIREVIRGGPE